MEKGGITYKKIEKSDEKSEISGEKVISNEKSEITVEKGEISDQKR